MSLTRLWVAMLTRAEGSLDPGTDSKISLSINIGGTEILNQVFPDTEQIDQDEGQANLYKFDVERRRIEPGLLTNSSVRLQILGDDAWNPAHLFAWGEVPPRTAFQNTAIFPLVIETGITQKLSTDTSEGVSSIPLRLVAKGGSGMRINRLLILLTTLGGQEDDSGISATAGPPVGTDNALEIQIVSNDRLVVLSQIRSTSQDDLEFGAANFYTMPVIFPFTKGSLNNQSITLRITGGMDEWQPASFFMFGLDDAEGRPESIVPLVYLPEWPFGLMSPDSTNGIASITLPLVVENFVTGDFDSSDTVRAIRSIETGQEKTNRLLEQLIANLR
jgi:hypothetical protein